MKIIIFDTWSGLCNQFYDIFCGINFCLYNNYKFTFRYCSFRNKDLISWYNIRFDELFYMSLFQKYEHLYVDYDTLQLTSDNTYNLDCKCSIELFTNNYIYEINQIDKEYIILKQFCGIHQFTNVIDNNIYNYILPSNRLIDLYNKIKNDLCLDNCEYNFIHYRYEHDFTTYFDVKIENLENLIERIEPKFKNQNLKIYIATSNIKNVIDLNNSKFSSKIITKNEDELTNYNFEELAFIDYMFGLNSNEVFGHNKSSFSIMLNSIKQTNNYYN